MSAIFAIFELFTQITRRRDRRFGPPTLEVCGRFHHESPPPQLPVECEVDWTCATSIVFGFMGSARSLLLLLGIWTDSLTLVGRQEGM